jgi:hypothetical protein
MTSDDTRQNTDEIGVLDLFVAIAESWIVIVFVPLLAMGGAYLTMRDADTYTASASLAVSPVRVQRVLEDKLADVIVTPANGESTRISTTADEAQLSVEGTRISVTADTTAEAQQSVEGAIDLLATAPFLSETETQAEVAAVAIWSEEADKLRQSLERVEGSYEASVSTDPGSYASAVTLLMTELAAREHNLRGSEIRLSQKVVAAPDAVQISVSPDSAFSVRTLLVVGFAAGLLTVLAVLLRNTLARLDPNAPSKFARIRRAFFIPSRTASK